MGPSMEWANKNRLTLLQKLRSTVEVPMLLRSAVEVPMLLRSAVEVPMLLRSAVEVPMLLLTRLVFLKSVLGMWLQQV